MQIRKSALDVCNWSCGAKCGSGWESRTTRGGTRAQTGKRGHGGVHRRRRRKFYTRESIYTTCWKTWKYFQSSMRSIRPSPQHQRPPVGKSPRERRKFTFLRVLLWRVLSKILRNVFMLNRRRASINIVGFETISIITI